MSSGQRLDMRDDHTEMQTKQCCNELGGRICSGAYLRQIGAMIQNVMDSLYVETLLDFGEWRV